MRHLRIVGGLLMMTALVRLSWAYEVDPVASVVPLDWVAVGYLKEQGDASVAEMMNLPDLYGRLFSESNDGHPTGEWTLSFNQHTLVSIECLIAAGWKLTRHRTLAALVETL